jgi:hypothetical protein
VHRQLLRVRKRRLDGRESPESGVALSAHDDRPGADLVEKIVTSGALIRRIGLLFSVRVLAMIAFDAPLWMLADPLGNVGLGGHGTLRQRAVPHVFETLLLAVIGVRQRTNRNHNRYQIHEISPSEDPATHMQLS